MPSISAPPSTLEIPPRARRRAKNGKVRYGFKGNTSACAEKRAKASSSLVGRRIYLRVRGEERLMFGDAKAKMEIPPRARRRDTVVAA